MELRPYQRECIDAIVDAYRRGSRRVLVSLPTGTGKTFVFGSLPAAVQMKRRMLVLAHRRELLEQARDKMLALDPTRRVGLLSGESDAAPDDDVVVASVQALGRADSRRLSALDPEQFMLLVVDEAHHAVADSYRRVLHHFGLFQPRTPRLLVGFTATPFRGDKTGLGEVFERVVFERSLLRMMREGFLCPIRGWRVHSAVDLDGVKTARGDFVERQLAEVIDVDDRNNRVCDAYARLAPGASAIVFCAGVEHARHLATLFAARGVPAEAVWGAMGSEERRAALGRYREQQTRVLTNCNVLTEGFDEPRTDCVIMARPTQSKLLYAQMLGRGTRLFEGKTHLDAIDIVDEGRRVAPVGLADVFGLPHHLDLDGREVTGVLERFEQLRLELPWIDVERVVTARELPFVAERIDLFRFDVPAELRGMTGLQWVSGADGSFRLLLPAGERFEVKKDLLDRFHIELVTPKERREYRPRGSLDEALAAVERLVEKHRPDALRVLDVGADWRAAPATGKQLALLKRRHVPYPVGLTRGQASWMIAMSSDAA